jgi:type IV pilus assembly protein PilO
VNLREFFDELKELDLRELNPRDLANWPPAVRLVSLVLTFVVVLLLGYFLFVRSELTRLHAAQRQERALRATFVAKAQLARELPAYRRQLVAMHRTYRVLLNQLPSRNQIPTLLRDISTTAQLDGLNQKLFKPEHEVRKAFYAEQPIAMEYTGTYREVGKFVADVASLPRIVTLGSLHLAPVRGAPGLLHMRVMAMTYRYLRHASLRRPMPGRQP